MKSLLKMFSVIFIFISIVGGGFFLKGFLPSTVTIISSDASHKICVEADFGGRVDADCFDGLGKVTLSSRMKSDGSIYLTSRQGGEASQRTALVYAGRSFPMHCDVTVDGVGEMRKKCRESIYADFLF